MRGDDAHFFNHLTSAASGFGTSVGSSRCSTQLRSSDIFVEFPSTIQMYRPLFGALCDPVYYPFRISRTFSG